MGTGRRLQPEKLAQKLKIIREKLGLTADELIKRLDCPEIPLYRASISQYEKGQREPILKVLLRYAQVGGVSVESLIDDEVELDL